MNCDSTFFSFSFISLIGSWSITWRLHIVISYFSCDTQHRVPSIRMPHLSRFSFTTTEVRSFILLLSLLFTCIPLAIVIGESTVVSLSLRLSYCNNFESNRLLFCSTVRDFDGGNPRGVFRGSHSIKRWPRETVCILQYRRTKSSGRLSDKMRGEPSTLFSGISSLALGSLFYWGFTFAKLEDRSISSITREKRFHRTHRAQYNPSLHEPLLV